MLKLTTRLTTPAIAPVQSTLALTAEERTRSRHRFSTVSGEDVHLCLPRGTVLKDGDLLHSDPPGTVVQVIAKPEPVLTVTAPDSLTLMRAAYHLGNRHVPLEVSADYLRLSPDSVLEAMLEQLGLQVRASVEPFYPEAGAYHSH
jgi:urease accessory protein